MPGSLTLFTLKLFTTPCFNFSFIGFSVFLFYFFNIFIVAKATTLTIIILAPELISYKYEITNPQSVNIVAKIELIIIIFDNLFAKVSAKYVGIARRAITKMSPTAFIAATTHKLAKIKISV